MQPRVAGADQREHHESPSSAPTGALPGPEHDDTVIDRLDAMAQTLFAASLIAEALSPALEHSPSQAQSGLDELHRLIKSALGELYDLRQELRASPQLERLLAEKLHHPDPARAEADSSGQAPEA